MVRTHADQKRNALSRRHVLQGLAAFLLPLSIGGCAQSSSSTAVPTPAPARRPPGSVLYTYRGHTDRVTTVAWSPDGKYIASGSLDRTVQVWEDHPDETSHPFIFRGHADGVQAIAWSPDSKRLLSGSLDKTVQVWDALSGEQRMIFHGHTDIVMTVGWSPDGNYIASGSADGTLRMWEVGSGQLKYVYRGHSASVHSLSWSPDSRRIVSGSEDTTVQIIDALTGDTLSTYRGHSKTVSGVAWSPDGKRIASGSWDKTVQVWDAATGALAYAYRGYNVEAAKYNFSKGVLPDLILALAWSHNGKRIVAVTQVYCGDSCGVVVAWDADTQRNVTFYTDVPVFAIDWSPDDTRLVTSIVVSAQASVVAKQANTWNGINGSFAQISQA
jgi:WD40 repeat protein